MGTDEVDRLWERTPYVTRRNKFAQRAAIAACAAAVAASASPAAAGPVWPASAARPAVRTVAAQLPAGRRFFEPVPPPAPAPDVVSPPSRRPGEGFVPPATFPGTPPLPRPLRDDDPVGRRFVEPVPPPAPPPGLEIAEDPATGGPSLSLEEALSLASQNNPTLRQAQAQVQGTLGMAVQAGLWPNPTVIYAGDNIGIEGTAGEFHGGQIQQEFITADKRDISRAKYLQRSKAAEWVAAEQQWRVCNDVRMLYWRALGQRELLAVRRELLKTAEDEVVTARERWNVGQETRAGLHAANVVLQQARLDLLMTENDYVGHYEELVAVIGCPVEGRTLAGTLDGEVRPVAFEAALADYYAAAPQVLRARAHMRESQITLKRELVEPVPNVFAQAGPGYDFTSNRTVAQVQVWLDVPIFDYNQGTIREAEADVVRQRSEIRRIEQLLRQDLARTYRGYLTALQHVEQFREVILPEAREAYREQLDAYKEDRQNWGDVLAAQRRYFDLRALYVTHLIALRTNETLVNGYLLTGGLVAPPNATPPGHIDAVARPR